MKIVKNHYIVSEKVKKYSQIKDIVKEMIPFIDGGIKSGLYSDGFAVAHSQVEDKNPLAFFVVNSIYVGKDKMWEDSAIINPEIIEAPKSINVGSEEEKDMKNNVVVYEEGCFSFPHRKPKKVKRYFRIKVRYYTKGLFSMKIYERWIEGMAAHVFQHELQHLQGKNIYFEK
jgi:peptide deformylase